MLFHRRIHLPLCRPGRNRTEARPFATTMPRYYLHVCNGDGFTQDEEGFELPDVHAARTKAVRCLRDIMASELKDGVLKTASFIEIEDENHELLLTVPFSEAVTVQEPAVRKQLKRERSSR